MPDQIQQSGEIGIHKEYVMKLRMILIPVAALFLLMSQPASGNESDPVSTAEAFVEALSRADLPALIDLFADDATLFSPSPRSPERIDGKDSIQRLFEPILSRLRQSGDGPVYMNLVPRDLKAQVMGDTAIVTFHLGQVPKEPAGQPYSFSRRTVVLQRTADRWLIVHLHASSVIIKAGAGD
jgi:ketosteroid isomerase-like protein